MGIPSPTLSVSVWVQEVCFPIDIEGVLGILWTRFLPFLDALLQFPLADVAPWANGVGDNFDVVLRHFAGCGSEHIKAAYDVKYDVTAEDESSEAVYI